MSINYKKILIAVAAIDGLIHPNEKQYLLEELSIDVDDKEYAIFLEELYDNVNNDNFLISLIKGISQKYEREECIHHLTKLIAVDSIFHEKENEFIILISKEWNISLEFLLRKVIMYQREIIEKAKKWYEYFYFICNNEDCNQEITIEKEEIFPNSIPTREQVSNKYNEYECSDCSNSSFIIYDSSRKLLFSPQVNNIPADINKPFNIKGLALDLLDHAQNFYENKDRDNLSKIHKELEYRIANRLRKGKKPTYPSLLARDKVSRWLNN
mgnify:FL=1